MNEHIFSDIDLFERYTRHRVLYHIGFWTFFVLFFGFLWGTYDFYFYKTFTIELAELPAKLVVVYVTLYLLIPKLLFKRKTTWFIVLFLSLLVLVGFAQRAVNYYVTEPMFFPERIALGYFKTASILTSFIGLSTAVAIPFTGKLLKHWFLSQQQYRSLEKEKLQAEIAFLKSQIHPHFLFNILNSLYALSLKKSDKAPDLVMRLSDLMHYMLYEANHASISLEKEIEFLKNYIALEEVRYEDRFELTFNCLGDVSNCQISPLILLPFVENSFKHGVNKVNKDGWLHIDLKVEKGILTLLMENDIPLQEQPKTEHGIGLKNVRRRLELLYPEKYVLHTEAADGMYNVYLQLDLNGMSLNASN